MELRYNSLFQKTGHLTQTGKKKPATEALPLKECNRGFIAHTTHFTYKVKLVRSPYLGLFMIPFIQIKSKINKKSRSPLLTP